MRLGKMMEELGDTPIQNHVWASAVVKALNEIIPSPTPFTTAMTGTAVLNLINGLPANDQWQLWNSNVDLVRGTVTLGSSPNRPGPPSDLPPSPAVPPPPPLMDPHEPFPIDPNGPPEMGGGGSLPRPPYEPPQAPFEPPEQPYQPPPYEGGRSPPWNPPPYQPYPEPGGDEPYPPYQPPSSGLTQTVIHEILSNSTRAFMLFFAIIIAIMAILLVVAMTRASITTGKAPNTTLFSLLMKAFVDIIRAMSGT